MTPDDRRARREPPERMGPIRNPLTPTPQMSQPGNPFRDALECGVRTAYTVIDDYMRRGYEAARSSRDQANRRGNMPDDNQNYGGWNNPWGPMAAPFQQWMYAMQAWMNAWSGFVPGGWPQQMWGTFPGFGGATAPVPVCVEVTAYKPVSVSASVSLSPGAECMNLTLGPVTGEPPAGTLNEVALAIRQGTVVVVVTVEASQAAGKYHGDISAQGRCVGALNIVIADPPRNPE